MWDTQTQNIFKEGMCSHSQIPAYNPSVYAVFSLTFHVKENLSFQVRK